MKPAVVPAVAALAAAVVGCGAQTAGQASLPPLRLTDAGLGAQGQAALAPGAIGAGSGFELRTTLATTTPRPAPVWHLPAASAADAGRVAAALGIAASPTKVSGGWVARGQGLLLVVRSDGGWTWGMDCAPDRPIEQESLDVMCASASGGAVAVPAPAGTSGGKPVRPSPPPTPPPVPAGPTEQQARALASPILQRLGWADGRVDVTVGAPTSTVTARRLVEGTPTADWLTTLDFQRPARLVGGSGYVGGVVRGRDYPLISAARAFTRLRDQPRALPEICQVRKDGKPGCAPIPPTVITGASLGLALRHDFGTPVLVPAWLFTVAGSSQPLAVVAVDPRWLKPPVTTKPS